MNDVKRARTSRPIHELIANRWSPYGFSDRPVAQSDIDGIFEAARWAPSSYNEQPWSYILGTKEHLDQYEKVLSCLVEANQKWAVRAPVLALGCTSLFFELNGKPNAAAVHDLGLASAMLVIEATARGLSVHQMIGIRPEKARETFRIPEAVQPITALAIGYADEVSRVDEPYRTRDLTPRERKEIERFVFTGDWGNG